MKKFVTLFPRAQNIHLIKDVGSIPEIMGKEKEYESYLACYQEEKFSYIDTQTHNIKLMKIEKRYKSDILNGLFFLKKHSNEIAVLNLYHFSPKSFIWILAFSFVNKSGKIYLKLDMDPTAGMQMKMNKNSIKWFITKFVLNKCKVVSVETKAMSEYSKKHWPVKLEWIPNGIFSNEIDLGKDKENIILTVGRIGTKQKATENLIEAFSIAINSIDCSWSLYLVGSRTAEFDMYLKKQISKNPLLSKRIKLFDNIDERSMLEKIYSQSSIFCLPSRWEGFCLVLGEALAKGCYIISSNIISAEEITCNGQFGELVTIDDVKELTDSLVFHCKNKTKQNFEELEKWLNSYYTWESISDKLEKLLNE